MNRLVGFAQLSTHHLVGPKNYFQIITFRRPVDSITLTMKASYSKEGSSMWKDINETQTSVTSSYQPFLIEFLYE